MGHTQDTPHMKIADLEDTITELEQENRELQISCDGFAEQCSRLQAKILNIEEGLRRLDKRLDDGVCIKRYANKTHMFVYHGVDKAPDQTSAPTLADLIDAILIGGGTDES